MTRELLPHPTINKPDGPVVVVVADGVGIAPAGEANAVTQADTPTIDALLGGPLSTTIAAHGTAVGLPSDDDMGNSEVGHNAIGAGRIFDQGAKLVNSAIDSGSLWKSPVWQELVGRGATSTMHLIGLHSDGNVHSHTDHLYAMVRRAAADGVTRARLHILLDGRDVAARSAQIYIETTEKILAEVNADHDVDFQIASGGGRMTITMDRYGADWPMVERGWRCHTLGQGRQFASAGDAVEAMYQESDRGDQYLDPFVVVDNDAMPVGTMADGDGVLLWNFRGDRAIEISQAYESDDDTVGFDRGSERPDIYFAGLLQYDGDLDVPNNYLVDPPQIDATMGEYLAGVGIGCFAVSETQKFGHVTFFWNGNRSGLIDDALETYVEIPSDNVAFNEAPAMKAEEITDTVIELIETGRFDWGRLNYANGDMVGHTGDLQATIASIEAMDSALARLVAAVERHNGILIFTADHGNADIMFTESNGERTPKTSHTTSPVPFTVHGADPAIELSAVESPGLANIAATVINLLGFVAPADYEPSLISATGAA